MDYSCFQDRLAAGVLLGDGAMGTMLYNQGVFINQCFELLNLTNPTLVQGIHEAYIAAGVDFIETNTFGANAQRLAKYGLAGQLTEINESSAKIARQAAGDDVLVAGSVGPLGIEMTAQVLRDSDRIAELFRDQAKVLIGCGVDFIILETFSSTEELLIAVQVISELGDIPIVAQLTADERHETVYGEPLTQALPRIAAEPAVTAVGLNCSTGPSAMLASLDVIRGLTEKPLSLQPNAGLPRRVEDRTIYMCTPEYMAEYAKRFFEKGARIIGGCCGTTPEHLAQMAKAVRSLDKAVTATHKTVPATIHTQDVQDVVPATPLAEKSALGAKLAAGEWVTTIEITPPRGVDLSAIVKKAKLCADMGVDAINIPDGPRASSRMSPLVAACQIQMQVGIETILHFCCRDRNLIGMQSDILGAAAMGLKNLLIITGDPPKCGEYPDATGVFDMDSVALTGVLRNLNRGTDIGGNQFSPTVAMTIGVGANPVAADMEREIKRYRAKVEAGAEYAITQPVFDPACLFQFLDAVGGDMAIPVVAGIWPFTSFKNAEFMANEVPGVSVPDRLLERMQSAESKDAARCLGIQIAQEMIEEIQSRVSGFAVSAPFGNVRTALAVLGKIEVESL
ncbi:bifunctional homocysteine S-methyltransferase/methylenetetrahydrofolate reductase [Planctomycetota bacterium]